MEAAWVHRPPEQRSQPWIDRQLDKINKALRAMSQGR
jgi:glutathione S-transferase